MFCKLKFLQLHRKNHLDKNGHYPCKHCSKMYPDYGKIKRHILNTHVPGFCKDCNKSFFCVTSYERHRKTVHIDQSIKKFKCNLCAFETHAHRYILVHKQRMHATEGYYDTGWFNSKISFRANLLILSTKTQLKCFSDKFLFLPPH